MTQEWHYSSNGQQHGPISAAELKGLAASGKLKPTDSLWKQGMANWIPAGSLKGLFPSAPAVASPPPPPPPQAASPPPVEAKAAAPAGAPKQGLVAKAKERLQSPEVQALAIKAKSRWQASSTPIKAGVLGGAAVAALLLFLAFCVLPLAWFFGGSSGSTAGSIRARDLLQSFLDNRQAAEKQYLGQTVAVRGVIEDVMNEYRGAPQSGDGNVVRLETGSSRGEVTCTFSLKHAKKLMELGKGKEIVFSGKCGTYKTGKWKEGEAGFLEMEDCELISPAGGSGGSKTSGGNGLARANTSDGDGPADEDADGGGSGKNRDAGRGKPETADEALGRLHTGMSKQEVRNVLGEPDVRTPIGQGEACLYYISATEAVFLTFDKRGQLFTMAKQDREP